MLLLVLVGDDFRSGGLRAQDMAPRPLPFTAGKCRSSRAARLTNAKVVTSERLELDEGRPGSILVPTAAPAGSNALRVPARGSDDRVISVRAKEHPIGGSLA